MNNRDVSRLIASRSARLTQDAVAEVLDLLAEIISEELRRPQGYIYLRGLGRLHVDYHVLQAGGIMKSHARGNRKLHRLYFRFNPTEVLKAEVREALNRSGGQRA